MGKYRVVVTDQVFPDVETERELLARIGAELEVADGDRDAVLEVAADADALLNTYMAFDADSIARLRNCKVIARYGIGVDNIDLDAAREAGIVVTNVPDYCLEEVAVHSLTLLLGLQRRLVKADAYVREGGWGIGPMRPISRVSELHVGLVGYGKIARQFAQVLRALGAAVSAYDPYVTADPGDGTTMVDDLSSLLSRADAVSIHVPLTPETRGMISADELSQMQEHALLINTSRGPLVVFDDLANALRAGQIAGAALDVFEQEPPDAAAVREVPNLISTPHMGFYSDAAIRESQTKATRQVTTVLEGTGDPEYRVS